MIWRGWHTAKEGRRIFIALLKYVALAFRQSESRIKLSMCATNVWERGLEPKIWATIEKSYASLAIGKWQQSKLQSPSIEY